MLAAGVEGDAKPFDRLALEVFRYQYAHNEPYRVFCEAKRSSPDVVESWREIPAFPTEAFKAGIVTSFPLEEAVMANVTSGTTSPNRRGMIFRDELGRRLALTANRVMTGAYLFPDFQEGERCRILILAPSLKLAPGMGMAIGMEETRKHFGTPDSTFLLGRTGIEAGKLVDALRRSESDGVAVALVGSTSAFVYFLRACAKKGMRFALPAGSRIADGGGYRGRFGELTRDDYYELVGEVLGIEDHHCVNTLGMAECGTNYFDNSLRGFTKGGGCVARHKSPPPWTRVIAASVEDLSPLPPGEVGLLRHYDLINLPTVLAVQTDNLGFTDDRGGFEIVGRARIVDGKVSATPDLGPVGPMGSRRGLRLLEKYVNFSIDLKMSLMRQRRVQAPEPEPAIPDATLPSCPGVVDDMVAAAEDPTSAERAEAALRVFERAYSDADKVIRDGGGQEAFAQTGDGQDGA
ncbi:MAG: acyl-protein synthetase [Actinobacteria bacterium]|nr:MAG: acyl-protein synthetase [Actinomycetota bacterium]